MLISKGISKKISCLILSVSLLSVPLSGAISSTVLASPITSTASSDINLTQGKTLEKLSKSEDKLINFLKTNSSSTKDAKSLISEFFNKELKNSEKFNANELNSLNESAKKNREAKTLIMKTEKSTTSLRKAVKINDDIVEFYENGTFAIEHTVQPVQPVMNSINMLAARQNVYGQTYRDYYSWVGLYIFTVGLSSNFWYDGTTAGYNGGFNAYHKHGSILSIWQVSDWLPGNCAAGNNYEAYTSGYFHMGFEYQGFGFVVDDANIVQRVTCSPNGTISTYYGI